MGDGEEGRGGLGNLMKERRKGGETVIGPEEMINKDKISKILAFQFKGGFQRRLQTPTAVASLPWDNHLSDNCTVNTRFSIGCCS